jgi:hypothetical protein
VRFSRSLVSLKRLHAPCLTGPDLFALASKAKATVQMGLSPRSGSNECLGASSGQRGIESGMGTLCLVEYHPGDEPRNMIRRRPWLLAVLGGASLLAGMACGGKELTPACQRPINSSDGEFSNECILGSCMDPPDTGQLGRVGGCEPAVCPLDVPAPATACFRYARTSTATTNYFCCPLGTLVESQSD